MHRQTSGILSNKNSASTVTGRMKTQGIYGVTLQLGQDETDASPVRNDKLLNYKLLDNPYLQDTEYLSVRGRITTECIYSIIRQTGHHVYHKPRLQVMTENMNIIKERDCKIICIVKHTYLFF